MNSLIPAGRVRFSALSQSCGVPETTMRRQLNFLGISIPSAGFRPSRASKVGRLIHASYCLSGWRLVSGFSSNEDEIKKAKEQEAKYSAEIQPLTSLLQKN